MSELAKSIGKQPSRPLCADCTTLPTGIEGHQQLRARTLGSTIMQFECGACGARWSRSDKAGGGYNWHPVDPNAPFDRANAVGVPLPRR